MQTKIGFVHMAVSVRIGVHILTPPLGQKLANQDFMAGEAPRLQNKCVKVLAASTIMQVSLCEDSPRIPGQVNEGINTTWLPSNISSNEFFIKILCVDVEVAPTVILIIRVTMNRTKLKYQNGHMHVPLHLVEVIVVVKVVVVIVELYLSSFRLHLSSQALADHTVCLCSRPYLKHDFLLYFFCQASER